MSTESEQKQQRLNLAEVLRDLRKAAGLSGERLAARCGMSQSKISRIESGEILATVIDTELWVTALKVPERAAQEILDLARTANVEHMSWRTVARLGFWRKQEELRALAESSTTVRQFLPAIPTGLVQTREYAEHAMAPMVPGEPARDLAKAVDARLRSQEVLNDPDRRFVLLMTEQALRWKRAPIDAIVGTLGRIAEVSENPNVEVGVIPQAVPVYGAPMNTFVVYDRRLVLGENFSGEVVLRDPRDVAHHLELFDFFLSHALVGVAATRFVMQVRDEFIREGG